MQKRKCIGVFLGQPNLPYQTKVLDSIAKEAFQSDCDVAVYSSIVANGAYDNCKLSAEKIMDLVNFDKLDAVIVLPDTLKMSENHSEYVIEQIKKHFKGVCVSLDISVPEFQSFHCDDRKNLSLVVEHVIAEHGCRDIAFITGPKTHPHSHTRLNGYLDVMKKHGIAVSEDRIFYGDFWYNMADDIVQQLVSSDKGCPQAICCANQPMAIAVYDALLKRNYRVPEDVILTGFDFFGNEINPSYSITSALRDEEVMVAKAMAYIRTQLHISPAAGQDNKECILFNESCGCKKNSKAYPAEVEIEKEEFFFSFYNFMSEDLISAHDIKECIWKIDWYTENIENYNRIWICLCDDWNSLYKDPTDDFSDRMFIALDKRPNDREYSNDFRVDAKRTFDTRQMLPEFGTEEKPSIYYFNTLYFDDNCFGYIVLNYSSEGKTYVYNKIFPYWVRYVNTALESLKRLYAVNVLYKNAEQKAITDIMTGMYNRNGYNIMIQEMMNSVQDNENFLIMLFDNNGLKQVNDTYGHVAGDEVIRISANVVSGRYFSGAREEKNFRIGGDEYVKLVVGEIDHAAAEECICKIQAKLCEKAQEKGYPVQLAGGYELCSRGNMPSVDQLMNSVDKRMYTNKQFLKEKQ